MAEAPVPLSSAIPTLHLDTEGTRQISYPHGEFHPSLAATYSSILLESTRIRIYTLSSGTNADIQRAGGNLSGQWRGLAEVRELRRPPELNTGVTPATRELGD